MKLTPSFDASRSALPSASNRNSLYRHAEILWLANHPPLLEGVSRWTQRNATSGTAMYQLLRLQFCWYCPVARAVRRLHTVKLPTFYSSMVSISTTYCTVSNSSYVPSDCRNEQRLEFVRQVRCFLGGRNRHFKCLTANQNLVVNPTRGLTPRLTD